MIPQNIKIINIYLTIFSYIILKEDDIMGKLPEMYHNSINKKIDNNEKYYTTFDKKKDSGVVNNKNIKSDNYTVEQKIYNIFNSPNYIYKIDVTIITDNSTMNKRIVGKNRNNLITMDGEYIPINTIRDIYISK